MLKKLWIAMVIVLILAGCSKSVHQQATAPVCPPRPQRQTASIIEDYWEPTRRITFYADAIENYAESFFSEFGGFHEDMMDGKYTLWVDARYDFYEVLEYLQRSECHIDSGDVFIGGGIEYAPMPGEVYDLRTTPTPTLEPGGIPITDGPSYYSAVEDGKCYVDIPGDCGGPCPVEQGREVSCDDWETPVQASPIPTSTIVYELYVWAETRTVFEADANNTLLIHWPSSIIVTDALSQTLTFSGPVTVRFAESPGEAVLEH